METHLWKPYPNSIPGSPAVFSWFTLLLWWRSTSSMGGMNRRWSFWDPFYLLTYWWWGLLSGSENKLCGSEWLGVSAELKLPSKLSMASRKLKGSWIARDLQRDLEPYLPMCLHFKGRRATEPRASHLHSKGLLMTKEQKFQGFSGGGRGRPPMCRVTYGCHATCRALGWGNWCRYCSKW